MKDGKYSQTALGPRTDQVAIFPPAQNSLARAGRHAAGQRAAAGAVSSPGSATEPGEIDRYRKRAADRSHQVARGRNSAVRCESLPATHQPTADSGAYRADPQGR